MLVETFEQWVVASKKVNTEVLLTFKNQPDPGKIADMIAGYLTIDIADKEKDPGGSGCKETAESAVWVPVQGTGNRKTWRRTFLSRCGSRSNRTSGNITCGNS